MPQASIITCGLSSVIGFDSARIWFGLGPLGFNSFKDL